MGVGLGLAVVVFVVDLTVDVDIVVDCGGLLLVGPPPDPEW